MTTPQFKLSTHGCDLQRIQNFLNSDHYHLEDAELIAHLDACPTCRQYLESQAGEPDRWKQATQLLQASEFDQASSMDYSAATCSGTDVDQPVAVKEVLGLLVPSEYPNHLGRLGTYEVIGVIGVGGMGVVLKAIDPSLDRVVAVKVMSPRLAHNENARKRFAREAKAAAAVLHPNVIPIHSVSSGSTLPFLVMSYIRGGSLQKRLDHEGALQLVEVLRIGSQIAAGLAAAHEQGLIHRDIKPENILLEEGVERVTITDFGLARSVDDNTITQMGSIAGTPQYMSPEQARGEPLDQQSDLFSLGSLLYALCTGRPPYRDDTSFGVMRKIIDELPAPMDKLIPVIPSWFVAIVEKLMAKQKENRFASASTNYWRPASVTFSSPRLVRCQPICGISNYVTRSEAYRRLPLSAQPLVYCFWSSLLFRKCLGHIPLRNSET
jgi:serine/threonine protein kinase